MTNHKIHKIHPRQPQLKSTPTTSSIQSSSQPQPPSTTDAHQAQPPSQGFSGRLFGLLKKFPLPMSSPQKDLSPLSEQGTHRSNEFEEDEAEEHQVDDDDEEEEEEDDDDDDDEVQEEEEEQEEEEDPLGDDQCLAIMENYLLETTTRTNLLRTRTQTHFCPALRRRLDFELSRITPTIAGVSAGEYHGRDGSVLRQTMEHVARTAIEQRGIQLLGVKKRPLQSHEEQVWDEIEKTQHKRKRLLTNTTLSNSFKGSKQLLAQAEETNGRGPSSSARRTSSRAKPPSTRTTQDGFHARLPSTPVLSDSKPARLARRNESLISINGSPVVSKPDSGEFAGGKSDEEVRFGAGGSGQAEFTFVERSKWNELESKLKALEMEESERKKLDELLRGCLRMGG